MARVAGINLPKNKRLPIGLTYIKGVGRSRAEAIIEKLQDDIDIDNLENGGESEYE